MPRPSNLVPSYSHHKASGQAFVRVTDGTGKRRVVYLGKYGSEASRAEYRRVLAELQTRPVNLPTSSAGIAVAEVLIAFVRWAGTHYRHSDGTPTSEVKEICASLKPVRELYGSATAAEFGPLALRAVRERMIGSGWCRSVVNRRIDRVKRCFKWAVSMELVPPSVHHGLTAVSGLRRGRTDAPEAEPVKPVAISTVEATLPLLNRHVRAMARMQQYTGMRPGEVCRLRLADVDRSGDVWTYRPAQHKTAHHGKERIVMIGPRGRAVLEAFIAGGTVLDPTAPLFSPFRAREERFAEMRAARKSKVPPSQRNRRKAKPKRQPALVYTPHTYAHAVADAAEKAGVPHWHPNQMRHLYASEVRKSHGLEAAQVLLGHSKMSVTEVYAEKNEALARAVAAKIG